MFVYSVDGHVLKFWIFEIFLQRNIFSYWWSIRKLLVLWFSVLLSTQRRQFEQAKVAVPVILKVLKTVSLEEDDENRECQHLFDQAIGIADAIRQVCLKLVFEAFIISFSYFGGYFKDFLCTFNHIIMTFQFCLWQEGRMNEKLRALLGLYVLQIMVTPLYCLSTSVFLFTST